MVKIAGILFISLTASEMKVLVREICIFIQYRTGILEIYCIYDLGKTFVHCHIGSLEKGFSESLKLGKFHCRIGSLSKAR
jgi:hypothetical protein